jgi:hypothetical protein
MTGYEQGEGRISRTLPPVIMMGMTASGQGEEVVETPSASVSGYGHLRGIEPERAGRIVRDRRLLTVAEARSYLRRLAPDLLLGERELAFHLRLGFGPEALEVGPLVVFHPLDLLQWSQTMRARRRSLLC